MRITQLALFLSLAACGLSRGALAQEACPDPTPNVEATPGPTPKPDPKAWDAGKGLGIVLDADGTPAKDDDGNPIVNGRMTAPQNQTVPEAERTTPKVKVGGTLSCGVESVSDHDHYVIKDNDGKECTEDEEGYPTDGITYLWSGPGTFEHPDQAGTQWTAPAAPGRYTLTCTMDDTPTPVVAPETGDREDGAISVSCTVIVYKFSVQFVEDEVAAGAVGNEGHQSGFIVTASDGTAGVPDVSADTPEVTAGGLGPDETVTAKCLMDESTTDGDGKAYGTFTSGNRTQNTTISVFNLSPEDKSSDSIEQVWNSESDPWAYDPYFYYDEASPVTYNMSFSRGAIAGHGMSATNTSITGWEWDPSAGQDWDEDGFVDGDYEYVTYSEDGDPEEFYAWEGLSTWGSVSESAPGAYTSDQTVYWHDDFIMTYVEFAFTDESAFGPNGAEGEGE